MNPSGAAWFRTFKPPTKFRGLMHVEQVHAHEERSGGVDVHMRIVETGEGECPLQIDHACGGGHKPPDLGARAHSHNLLAPDGQRFRPRPAWVEGVDAAAHQRQISLGWRLSLRGGGEGEKASREHLHVWNHEPVWGNAARK